MKPPPPRLPASGQVTVRQGDTLYSIAHLDLGKGPILLAFYRGGWCPFCNSENHALATAYPEFQKRGVTPVTVSVDKPDAEAKTKAAWARLTIPPTPVTIVNDRKIKLKMSPRVVMPSQKLPRSE